MMVLPRGRQPAVPPCETHLIQGPVCLLFFTLQQAHPWNSLLQGNVTRPQTPPPPAPFILQGQDLAKGQAALEVTGTENTSEICPDVALPEACLR